MDAQQIINEQAEPTIAARIAELVESGEAYWMADPEVSGVTGLIRTATDQPIAIVYHESHDFEIGVNFPY